jgi:hypothetical protein
VDYDGTDLLALEPEERAAAGVFLAFQYPVEIPGVNNTYFLRAAAVNAQRKARGEPELDSMQFLKLVREKLAVLHLKDELLHRAVNEGFSGGEKKRNEIFQLALLEPKLAILDETDSGLDIDALKIVADGVNALRSPERAFLVITHYQRLLDYIKPDVVHVLAEAASWKAAARSWRWNWKSTAMPGSAKAASRRRRSRLNMSALLDSFARRIRYALPLRDAAGLGEWRRAHTRRHARRPARRRAASLEAHLAARAGATRPLRTIRRRCRRWPAAIALPIPSPRMVFVNGVFDAGISVTWRAARRASTLQTLSRVLQRMMRKSPTPARVAATAPTRHLRVANAALATEGAVQVRVAGTTGRHAAAPGLGRPSGDIAPGTCAISIEVRNDASLALVEHQAARGRSAPGQPCA